MKRVVILGAGITGLTIADELAKAAGYSVVVIEKEVYAGGLAATFSRNGLAFDLGSHRIHPETRNDLLHFLSQDLGVDLLKQPRKGALFLKEHVLRYPVVFFDFIRAISFGKCLQYAFGYLRNLFQPHPSVVSYEDAMVAQFGEQIYKDLYEDFAWKLWGMDPRSVSPEGMRRRSLVLNLKMLKKTFLGLGRYFYYPAHGIGEIAEKLEARVVRRGGVIYKGAMIRELQVNRDQGASKVMWEDAQGVRNEVTADVLISTIPVDSFYNLVFSADSPEELKWRGLRVLILRLKEAPLYDHDTFYFPERIFRCGRVSRIDKFSSGINASAAGTVLTVEFPSSPGEPLWSLADQELAEVCVEDLVKAGIYSKKPTVEQAFSANIEKVYPIYEVGWEKRFEKIFSRISSLKGVYTVGRRGLFLHSNIDHSIIQGMELAGDILKEDETSGSHYHYLDYREFSARD